jgi:hypothetical protein
MWEKFGCDGIYIIDIKDHFHPRIIKSYNFISKVSHFALSRDEKKLFVLDSAKNSIAILDVRDSGDVKVLGQLKLKTYDEYKGHIDSFSLSSNNDLIYFSVVAKGLYIVDAKNPKHMKILGSIQPFEYRINDWLGKFVVSDDDRIAFLTSTLNGDMVALDISNPEKIQNLGVVRRYDKPELNDVILSPGNLQWKGKRLYIGWHHMYASGVTVLDVGTPTSPQLIGEIKTQVSNFDFSASLTDFSEFVVSDDEKTIFIAPHNSGRYGKPTDADLTKNGLDIYSRQ